MLPPSANQSRILWTALTVAAITLLVACFAALVWALGRVLDLLSPVLWPLAVAVALAYLLDPVVDWLQKRKMKRQRAIICVFAFATLVVAGIGAAVIPRLVVESRELAGKVPEYARRLQQRVVTWVETKSHWDIPLLGQKPAPLPAATNAVVTTPTTNVLTNAVSTVPSPATDADWDHKAIESLVGWLPKALPAIGRGLADQVSRVAGLFGLIAGLALVPVYCFYFLLEKTGIQRRWTDYLPIAESRVKEEIVFVLTAINDRLIVFFRGQVLVAACDGVLYTIGFFAIGLNYAVLLGLIATVLTIVPFLGAIVTFIVAFILALVQFQDWLHPLLVVGVFAVVQTLEGLVISPKIIGDRVGLHPLTIIIAVMVGTTLLGGLLGGILAIPLTAALRVLMFRYVWKKE
jgi:predicted PurR-regulated permease PerM